MRRSALVIVLVWFWMPKAVLAQTDAGQMQALRSKLGNMPDVAIVARGLDATTCGLVESDLTDVLIGTIRRSRLRIRSESSDGSNVYLSVSALSGATCSASIDLSVRRPVNVISTAGRLLVPVWETSTIISGPADSFGPPVTATVREFVEQLLDDWIKANPIPPASP